MMGTVDICGPAWLHVSCELGPPCKVKSDRFAMTRGYEPWPLCHIVVNKWNENDDVMRYVCVTLGKI